MTCNDCIHQYCCKYDRFFGVDEVENKCNYFKNKADFVEVVRCKDCRHNKPTIYEGKHACIRQCAYKKPDDFCSYGEKRAECVKKL